MGNHRAVKYLSVFTLPVQGGHALKFMGFGFFFPLAGTFLLVPFIEFFFKPDQENPSEAEEENSPK
jgi:hypothetical protein